MVDAAFELGDAASFELGDAASFQPPVTSVFGSTDTASFHQKIEMISFVFFCCM